MKVKTNIALAAVTLAAATGYGANIVMQGSEAQTSFDITNPASWGVEAISAEDYATITTNGDIPTEAYIGSDQTFSPATLSLQNNAHLVASGSGSTITNNSSINNNVNFGSNDGSNVLVEILGSGNTYAIDATKRSFMMGAINSTYGSNKIYVSSSSSSNRNYFSISGVNIFVRLNSSAGSTASNTISIGDNSDSEFTGSIFIGGSDTSADAGGGSVTFEMIGTNSTMRFCTNSYVGNNSGTQSGGSAKILVSGSGNTFNSVGTTIQMNKTMTGGSNSFEISGENNTVEWQNIWVGSASSTGGSAKISVEGSTHRISAMGLGVYGSEVTDSDGNVTAVNGGSVEFISDEFGFSSISVGSVGAFDGILSIDFSNIDAPEGDRLEFALITANSDWSNIADKLISTSSDSENAHLNVITKNEEDTWELIYNGTSLYVAYTCVPEPSSFAAVFALGALVVAFARRRGK